MTDMATSRPVAPSWPEPLPRPGMWSGVGPCHLSRLARDPLVLPSWQRAAVWTPEQQAAFCASLWMGRVMHSHVLLWQRDWQSGAALIIDGQQRLTALGLPVTRHDGTVNACSSFLDVTDGVWYTERAPLRFTACELLDHDVWYRTHAEHGADAAYRLSLARQRMDRDFFALSVIERAPKDTVQAWFRTMAIPGVALTPEDAERLCAAVEGAE